MEKLTIIKLGGSVITDKSKPLTAKKSEIRRLGREIMTSKYKGKLIITHGSGSFGHYIAKKYKTAEGYRDERSLTGMVLTSNVAIEINRIVMEEFIKLDMKVKSFAPSSFIVAKNKRIHRGFIDPIKQLLKSEIIPVTFGDVVMDIECGFCINSAEKLINYMVRMLSNEYSMASIIYCTDTDGVYDEKGKTIKEITTTNYQNVKRMIGRSKSVDVTGGMLHKVKESLRLSKKYNLKLKIINGKSKNSLREELEGRGDGGTTIKD